MKYHCIPEGVLVRTFGCATQDGLDMYVRLETWGEGSCFFHSLAMLLVKGNRVQDNQVTYTLNTPNASYQSFTVNVLNTPFRESFRQVGIQLRKRLGKELEQNPKLWEQFESHVHMNLERTDKHQTMGGAIKELAQKEVWADIWTIRYCVWRLKVNALFVNPSSSQEPLYCGVENFEHENRTVFIYWSNHSHFEPIVQLHDNTIVRSFGQNHRFLKCLKEQYKRACPLDPIGK